MAWVSKTRKFDEEEIGCIERYSPKALKALLMNSGPFVALRGAAELLLHEEYERLDFLLSDVEFNVYWRRYRNEEVIITGSDCLYDEELENRIRMIRLAS